MRRKGPGVRDQGKKQQKKNSQSKMSGCVPLLARPTVLETRLDKPTVAPQSLTLSDYEVLSPAPFPLSPAPRPHGAIATAEFRLAERRICRRV